MNRCTSERSSPDARAPTLWRNGSFLRLWLAQLTSNTGSSISTLAIPLTAVLVLGATPTEMGALGALSAIPNLLIGLIAGVWVDRMQRRPFLIGADLGRALLLASIPGAALLGRLSFPHLYVVGFAMGILSVLFTTASVAVLPSIVRHEQLVRANSTFETSSAVIQVAGPGAAGVLIQLVTAPLAVALDAVSYVLSAVILWGIGADEPQPSRQDRRSMWVELADGVREVVRGPLLRALTVSGAIGALGLAIQNTVLLLFLTRTLGLGAATVGLAFAIGGGGAVLGAVLAATATRRLGVGPAVLVGQGVWTVGVVIVPLAGVSGSGLVVAAVGQGIASAGAAIWSVNQMSLRQHLTPVRLLGRVTAARRALLFSAAPVGALLGGFLGSAIGLRATLLVGALGPALALIVLCVSPIPQVRTLTNDLRPTR